MANTPGVGPGYPSGGVPLTVSSSGGESNTEQAIRSANSRGGFGRCKTTLSVPCSGVGGCVGSVGIDEPAKSLIGCDIDFEKI